MPHNLQCADVLSLPVFMRQIFMRDHPRRLSNAIFLNLLRCRFFTGSANGDPRNDNSMLLLEAWLVRALIVATVLF